MSRTSHAKKLKRAREVAMGAGFLLQKLQFTYGADFGVGMAQQVQQAINDCSQQAQALQAAEQQASQQQGAAA
jgi:hypothetical protein